MHLDRIIRGTVGCVTAAAALAGSGAARADWALNLRQGVTPLSKTVYDLHMIILWICVAIGVVVFSALFWSIFNHRKSKGVTAAHFHESTTVEILWTVVPFIILVGMAVPATQTLIAMENTGNADMSVVVTGFQWRWQYRYLDEDFSFYSALDAKSNEARRLDSGIDPASVEHYLLDVDKRLVLPTNKKIRILTTANDVIHAWWVPDLGWKRDAIPGYINESWVYIEKPGVYRGQCAELCGKDHGYMPIVVEAVDEATYRKWMDGQKLALAEEAKAADPHREWAMEELMAKGQEVYGRTCVTCHQADGKGIPGTFKPLAGSPVVNGPVEDQLDTVMYGVAGTAMPPWKDQLNDVEIAAVVTYTRNSFGNSTGDLVQPAKVEEFR